MHQHDHNSSIQFQTLLFTFLSGDEKGKNYLRSIRLTGDNRTLSHAIADILWLILPLCKHSNLFNCPTNSRASRDTAVLTVRTGQSS